MNGQDHLRQRYPMNRRTFVSMVAAGATSTLFRGTAAQPATKARNVVLVHGLFADGSSWSEVIPRLQAAGLNVTSVQNPLTTLSEAVASAERVLARQDGPTVLVGHSFSGMIVTEAGVHPNVSARMEYAAIVGGCATGATHAGAALAGREPAGTMPHALIGYAGSTVRAAACIRSKNRPMSARPTYNADAGGIDAMASSARRAVKASTSPLSHLST